jgi:hypothetical protein
MDLLTVMCRARACIERAAKNKCEVTESIPKTAKFDAPEWPRNAFDDGAAMMTTRLSTEEKETAEYDDLQNGQHRA